jgi:hypothetical protein
MATYVNSAIILGWIALSVSITAFLVCFVSIFVTFTQSKCCFDMEAKTLRYVGNFNLFFMTLAHIIFFTFEKERHDLNIRILHLE